MIMSNRSAGENGGNSTVLSVDAVMREGGIADRMQPMQLAGDTKSSLVQMPNAAFRQPGKNVLNYEAHLIRRTARPVGHARGPKKGRAEAVRVDPWVSAAEHYNRPPLPACAATPSEKPAVVTAQQ